MKKKMVLCLIVGALTVAILGGCGSKNTVQMIDPDTKVEQEQEADEKEDAQNKELPARDDDYPVLGDEDIEDYKGFDYLQWELLTSDSGDTVPVYVPMDEDAYKSDDHISGYNLGIAYSIELDPSIRMDEEDYRVTENLDYYLEDVYVPESNEDYYDIVISDAERIDGDTACAAVEYCRYYEFDDSYYAVFATYLLKRLDNGVTVLMEIKVNSDDVDLETDNLIDELETFYQCEVDWSIKRAEEKIEGLGEIDDGEAALGGSLAFDIPEDWYRDDAESDSDVYVYAPYGDADLADCAVSISREYTGMEASELEILENNQEFLLEMVKAQLANDDTFDGDVSFYEDTNLGIAVKAEMESEGEDGVITEIHLYLIFMEDYTYIVSAAQHGDAPLDDPFAVAEEILASARIKE